MRWLSPDYQIPRFGKGIDKQAASEEGAQLAAELIAAVEQKPSSPAGAVEQTGGARSRLPRTSEPVDRTDLQHNLRKQGP